MTDQTAQWKTNPKPYRLLLDDSYMASLFLHRKKKSLRDAIVFLWLLQLVAYQAPLPDTALHIDKWPVLVKLEIKDCSVTGLFKRAFSIATGRSEVVLKSDWSFDTNAQKRPLKYSAYLFVRMDLPAQEKWGTASDQKGVIVTLWQSLVSAASS